MKFTARKEDQGLTLLAFLRKYHRQAPSVKSIKRSIDAKQCKVNGCIERLSTRRLKSGDIVEIIEEVASLAVPILYEDEEVLFCNKPPGLACDPKEFPARLVHRLDKETSGVLVLAKTASMQEALEGLFEQRAVNKWYLALVHGQIPHAEGVCRSLIALEKKVHGQSIFSSQKQGKRAVTFWKKLLTIGNMTVVLCKPITGRTHQIRVHLKELGFPLIGDSQYGKLVKSSPKRQMLHAWILSFIHPQTKEMLEVEASLPQDFIDCLGATKVAHLIELANEKKKKGSWKEHP